MLPIPDLRNNLNEISEFCRETREPLTGYGFHHSSNDGAFHIMSNGTRAFAIISEDNSLRTAELSTEQKCNQVDGIINNQPTVEQLEQDTKSGNLSPLWICLLPHAGSKNSP